MFDIVGRICFLAAVFVAGYYFCGPLLELVGQVIPGIP
jgi:hypothetical protein